MSRKNTRNEKGKKPRRGTHPGNSPARGASAPAAPRAGRPNIPGYGIVGEKAGRGLLPWSWAEARLSGAHNYWLATTRLDGRPHVMPVWGVWWEGAFYFSTGDKSVKARNLAANPRCVVCPDGADEAVILEAIVELMPASPRLAPLWKAYEKKYAWDVKGSPFYAARPRAVFGFIEKDKLFTETATRWLFDSSMPRQP